MKKTPQKTLSPLEAIQSSPSEIERGYLARELVLCTLPHADPGDLPSWQRSNGDYTLTVLPGFDVRTNASIGYPYGSIPRLLLFWITSEAVRTQSRRINLGDNLNDFLRKVGLDPKTGGGKRGAASALREQMMRLLQCRISFDYTGSMNGRKAWLHMDVAPQGEFWWDVDKPDQSVLFESYIVLGEAFYKAITSAPVPIDFRALKALKRSPLALDLYAWTTYRVWTLQHTNTPKVEIPLSTFKEQFGAHYSRDDNFKAALLDALSAVKEVFPGFECELRGYHVVLKASPAPIASETPEKEYRRIAQTKKVTPMTQSWFKKTYPHQDFRAALKEFYAWVEKREIQPQDIDALFKTYAAKWTAK